MKLNAKTKSDECRVTSDESALAPISRFTHHASRITRRGLVVLSRGFTLLELLVVIGIIALISAIALPVLKTFKPDPLKTASNQLLNDLAYARHRAIADHTTVFVCFMPPLNLLSNYNTLQTPPTALWPNDQQKLLKSQYVGYAMYEKRSIGDQPGASQPHWITGWHQLPEGTAFPQEMFLGKNDGSMPPNMDRVTPFQYWSFDYKSCGEFILNPETNVASQVKTWFPAIAFDYRGGLVPSPNGWNQWRPLPNPTAPPQPPNVYYDNRMPGQVFDCVIPITQGHSDPSTNLIPANYRESPPGSVTNTYCHVVIDGPTGRARRDVRALQ
jgi:prepilin-type N-terminal cleavage/methylation domain-containing protein